MRIKFEAKSCEPYRTQLLSSQLNSDLKQTHCYSFRMCAVECRLAVLENRVPRRIFRTEEEEMTRGWRKLHSMELHNLYFHQTVLE
jgi:hypothetical protein